jgi:flagellar biosynthetic protein FliR
MHGEVGLPAGLLLGFLLVFTRMAGVFLLIPIPGVRTGPDAVRVIAALSLTIGVVSRWPAVELNEWTVTALLPLLVAEFVLGQAIGLAASVLAEAFLMAAQIISLQAGFSYASMIDPTTQNESTSLAVS